MKNLTNIFGIIAFVAVIGFTMTACDNSFKGDSVPTNGKLIITGLDYYKSDFVFAFGITESFSKSFLALNDFNMEKAQFKLERINSNGTVELNVWEIKNDIEIGYSGDDTVIFFVAVLGKQIISESHGDDFGDIFDDLINGNVTDLFEAIGIIDEVTFENGRTKGTFINIFDLF